MKCEQAEELFGVYWDLPEHAPDRVLVDIHIQSCAACAEQFRMWEESSDLIRDIPEDDKLEEEISAYQGMSDKVMSRIYSEQSWFVPTSRRTYSFTSSFRKKIAVVLAGLLAVFFGGFLYSTINRAIGPDSKITGVMETASAFAASHDLNSRVTIEVPTASLSEPYLLHVTPAMPEYWVALSMLGMIMTLLILNWFSRVRS